MVDDPLAYLDGLLVAAAEEHPPLSSDWRAVQAMLMGAFNALAAAEVLSAEEAPWLGMLVQDPQRAVAEARARMEERPDQPGEPVTLSVSSTTGAKPERRHG